MAIEKVKELLKAVKTDPEAQAKLSGLAKPKDEDGAIRYYAEAAKLLGFNVTEKDIREAVAAASKEQEKKTAADMEKLADNDVVKATGGEEDVFWTGEKAPDGHEMGCFAIYYSYAWQRDHDIWCRHEYYCNQGHYKADPCFDLNYCPGVIYQ